MLRSTGPSKTLPSSAQPARRPANLIKYFCPEVMAVAAKIIEIREATEFEIYGALHPQRRGPSGLCRPKSKSRLITLNNPKWTRVKSRIIKTHSEKLYSLVIEPKRICKPTRRALNSRNREDCEDCDSPFGESHGH